MFEKKRGENIDFEKKCKHFLFIFRSRLVFSSNFDFFKKIDGMFEEKIFKIELLKNVTKSFVL